MAPTRTPTRCGALLKPAVLNGSGRGRGCTVINPLLSQVLMYNWEQVDASTKGKSLSVENLDGPLFISKPPSLTGNYRHFPKIATALAQRPPLGCV